MTDESSPSNPPNLSDSPRKRRIVVLISGSGTNLQALINALNTPSLPNSHIVLVLSNRKNAHGLTRAAHASPPIPTHYLALQPYLRAHPGATRADYDAELARVVLAREPDVVVLAGWMHVLSEAFLGAVERAGAGAGVGAGLARGRGRGIPIINLHPSLPGADSFPGSNAIQRSYAAFQNHEVDRVGVMVHRVIREVDEGEPVVVREVPLGRGEGETLEVFEERLHKVEWEVIVEATRMVLDEVDGGGGGGGEGEGGEVQRTVEG